MHRFMSEKGLTFSAAATALGVERTKFWRFCNSGRAHEDTRVLYRKALEKCNKYNATFVADNGVKPNVRATQVHPTAQGALADSELTLIRKACEGVLALLDVYETQSLGRKK